MGLAKIISSVATIIHSLFTLFYFFISFRLNSLYEGTNIERPNIIISNWPLITFLIFAILSFLFWTFLKRKESQNAIPKYSLLVSIILLIAPFVIFLLVGMYANYQIDKIVNEASH